MKESILKLCLTQITRLTWTRSANNQQPRALCSLFYTLLYKMAISYLLSFSLIAFWTPLSIFVLFEQKIRKKDFFEKSSFSFPPCHFHWLFGFLLDAVLLHGLLTLLLMMPYCAFPSLFLLLLLPPPHTSFSPELLSPLWFSVKWAKGSASSKTIHNTPFPNLAIKKIHAFCWLLILSWSRPWVI